jgi:serine protease AprX
VTETRCPICRQACDARILALTTTLAPAIAALAVRTTPGWRVADGLCPACAATFQQQLAAQRSHNSLHTTVEPHTTFPYYHRDEERLLSQPERLPDYHTISGAGVTMAFLDSGYFPHPDLTGAPAQLGDALTWHQLTPQRWRALTEQAGLRLVEYADLTDGGERIGLDQPTLWDGAGDSWHGQMATCIAAGNGALSQGRYRGYAPEAAIVAIKIGRGGGRIPEEDILRGLQWLLEDDRWQRYGVRVVNISVGGDFPEEWQSNPVCRAAHALAQRGVFVAAAAGNRGVDELLAPAQTPSVMTVGGVEDHNQPWRPGDPDQVETLSLYHHNTGRVMYRHTPIYKPEILALGRWLPSPVLPPSHTFYEMAAIDQVRRVLRDENGDLPVDLSRHEASEDAVPDALVVDPDHWMPEVWQGLRQRMNAHKWVHRYYQHVDGTSVAVTQVAAVAAQIFQANGTLDGRAARELLIETALPLPHLLPRQRGIGLLQPARAVAAALRTAGGALVGFPCSGSVLNESELQKWRLHGTLPVQNCAAESESCQNVYFGVWLPNAARVSLIGAFNRWQPDASPLQRTINGWWHGVLRLSCGIHPYRFWVVDATYPQGRWLRDPENPETAESGYQEVNSQIVLE